jgi:transitional endoplasmic reticulum ATPase
VVFLDEVDSIARVQGDSNVLNRILAEIDDIDFLKKKVFIIGATNKPDTVDPAITSPGRLDPIYYDSTT